MHIWISLQQVVAPAFASPFQTGPPMLHLGTDMQDGCNLPCAPVFLEESMQGCTRKSRRKRAHSGLLRAFQITLMQVETHACATALPDLVVHKMHGAVPLGCGSGGCTHTATPLEGLTALQLITTGVGREWDWASGFWTENIFVATHQL